MARRPSGLLAAFGPKLDKAEPLLGVAPGQSAVLYLGTRVLGQFTIDRAIPV